ncbi:MULTISPECIES: cytochrome P450 [Mycolicibacterium]|jgi:cytochrome P450|uniref:Steroid C26-monooxygenase n=1 Tax=Mycolicibacterium vanbaalenii (strain DSM 7251 / JCM 13017 / BCRC 16820 / KCTC 9966 / NRRL B-24157 / PYR-1) TaxID=350058 RepID=A1T113_MYCVP|nr:MULTISPECIES: cytochrome P450 [Mycolicibacterium]ABM10863.1 cytochrome P450 [Mycolicibacterium vanbaalenii PYR-1]MCV7129736.1 cytochrome P450 [Mycolicibacterium vanbaalenii PYR-1]MDW5609253.1 cytochrome P450 [Mycolicibacterium sp. D5.8-2]QZT57095.1 cytochrome P450 [Mycolicibacterium austroafricanum]QZY46228.1 cytochrome P450 [Mycolicibacterium austroafricanum]
MTTAVPTHRDIDLSDRNFWARPHEERDAAFAVLRRENPVPWSRPADSDLLPPEQNLKGFWSLTKHEDIRYASRHPEIFSSAEGITVEDFPVEIRMMSQSFIAMDAPRHTQLRGITLDAFKPRNMLRLQDWIQGHARDLISEISHLGEGDFVDLVSVKLPGRIFGSFFGLPPGELHEKTINAAQRTLGWTDPEVRGDLTAVELFVGAVMDLHETVTTLLPERRANPGDDLLSWMVQAEFDGEKMTDDELKAFFTLLAVAANDTTRHASAHAILAFSQFPDQRDLLVADVEGRVDTAVEEVLRWASPLVHMRRTAVQDVTLRGSEIKAGDKVVLWYSSANRDEDIFEDPFKFDIARNPNPHIAFGGGGPHFCLGAALARTMLRSLLTEVYTRIPDISAPEPRYQVANFINGINSLPATWTPERR